MHNFNLLQKAFRDLSCKNVDEFLRSSNFYRRGNENMEEK